MYPASKASAKQQTKSQFRIYATWFALGATIGFLLGLPVELGNSPTSWFIDGIWPEALGIFFTVTIIDQLYRQREQRDNRLREAEAKAMEQQKLKTDLIIQLSSRVNSEAVRAAELLKSHNWLKDSSLWGADLHEANLANAPLSYADLHGVDFWQANLSGADLYRANLRNAHLLRADLRNARLMHSILSNAHLRYANLENAVLDGADLRGAYLGRANLKSASITDVKIDESCTLPDGLNWSPDTDLRIFTDSTHPKFWRSKEPSSPAYQKDP
ncbi:MAG: pentapeptide repeat-containing protein [Chloroflexota bacterium]|nr:pentapeptide repeat-containing protein [Chloroflexota bacterium]